MREQETIENLCLYRVQMEKRISRGFENPESKCYRCNGYDKWCSNYVQLKSQRQLMEVMGRGL